MIASYPTPPPPIDGYVRRMLVLEGDGTFRPVELPLFANGMPTLLCVTVNGRVTLTLFGQTVRPAKLPLGGPFTLIAYFLQPWSLPALFRLVAAELTDSPVALSDLYPGTAGPILNQLADARGVGEQRSVLETFLRQLMYRTSWDAAPWVMATGRLAASAQLVRTAEVSRTLHLSERTFQRQFKQVVGVSPERYRRIAQFDGAFQQLNSGAFDSLTDLAFDHRYTDQSHFNRTFKEFTGMTPTRFLAYGTV